MGTTTSKKLRGKLRRKSRQHPPQQQQQQQQQKEGVESAATRVAPGSTNESVGKRASTESGVRGAAKTHVWAAHGDDAQIGVSAAFLRKFFREKVAARADADDQNQPLTTSDVCQKIIIEETKAAGCAYVDLLVGQVDEDTQEPFLGKATVFISHAWRYDFDAPYSAMMDYADKHPGAYFWFDLFINNQNSAAELPHDWWTSTFKHNIEAIGTVLLVLAPWKKPIPLTRCWCLYEMMCSLTITGNAVDFTIALPPQEVGSFQAALARDYESALDALVATQAEEAEAFLDYDKQMIFQAIRESIGFDRLNALVKDQMREWFVQQALKVVRDHPQESVGKDSATTPADDTTTGDTGVAKQEGMAHPADNNASKEAYGRLCWQVGTMMSRFGRRKEAKELYDRALPLVTEALGEENDVVASIYNNLGVDFRYENDLEQALVCAEKALTLYQAFAGEKHKRTVAAYNNLASLHDEKGDQAKALELYEKALAITKEISGEECSDAAGLLNNIATIHTAEGAIDKAAPLYSKALEISKKVQGENHPDTATAYFNLATIALKTHDDAAALAHLQECLRIRESTLGSSHHDTTLTKALVTELNGNKDQSQQDGENTSKRPLLSRQPHEVLEDDVVPSKGDGSASNADIIVTHARFDRLASVRMVATSRKGEAEGVEPESDPSKFGSFNDHAKWDRYASVCMSGDELRQLMAEHGGLSADNDTASQSSDEGDSSLVKDALHAHRQAANNAKWDRYASESSGGSDYDDNDDDDDDDED